MFKRSATARVHGMRMDTMIETLAADGPFPDLAEELETFGRFVGAWDVDVSIRRPDGAVQRLQGEWHFGWALAGRAIVDVFNVPGRDHGVVVRFYDPGRRIWHISYSGAVSRRQILLAGRSRARRSFSKATRTAPGSAGSSSRSPLIRSNGRDSSQTTAAETGSCGSR